MTKGPLLDRPLEPHWLDLCLRFAAEETSPAAAKAHMERSLRDQPLADEARRKTVTALARVWIAPAGDARTPLLWARDAFMHEHATAGVHLVALMAAYPFFGSVCAAAGRALALEERLRTPDLR